MMRRRLFGVAALAVLASGAARAGNPPLPNLVNLNFALTAHTPKGSFSYVDPVGWTGGTGLIFIDSTTVRNQDAAGSPYLTTYGDPVGSVIGNYVEADGNPIFESGFNYSVSGLTVGKTYSLSFYQGASSQAGFGYNGYVGRNTGTTNQWIVSLGTSGLEHKTTSNIDPLYGPTEAYYSNDRSASIATSPLMRVPYHGSVGWQYVTVNLTADAPTDLLSFLAWGDNGSTVNLPPMAFLAGVDSPPGLGAGVAEPAAWALMLIGVGGLGGVVRAQRRDALIV